MNALREALYERVTADATLMALATGGVHHEEAAQDARPPYVLFEQVAGVREWTFGGPAMRNLRWIFEGVCMGGDAGPAEDIAARLETVLTDAVLSIDGAGLLYLRPVSDVEYPRRDGADRYYHSGAIYRVVTLPN